MRRWIVSCLATAVAFGVAARAEPVAEAEGRPGAAGVGAATAPATRAAHAPAGARVVSEGWFAPPPRSVPPPRLPDRIAKAFVIPIHGPIDPTMHDIVKDKAVRCITAGAEIIIFDMDTPGGRSDVMEDITRLITDDLAGTYTVAYVHPKAYSAGAIISLACTEIVFAPGGRFGDAMPIMIGSGGALVEIPEKERGKFESAARADVRALAGRNGYDVLMCEAMITITMELWLVRDTRTGELRVVDASEWRGKVGGAPFDRAETRPGAAGAAEWQYVRTIDGRDKLVTLTAEEAETYGFTKFIAPNLAAVEKHYNIVRPPTVLEDNWSESLVRFLTSPVVSGILMFVGIIGIYMEMQHPGVSVPGIVGALAFAVLFGSRYLTGLAQWWEVALFVIGVLLIVFEVLVFPGHGVSAIVGAICCIVGLVAIIVPNAPGKLPLPNTELAWNMLQTGLLWLCIAFIAAIAAIIAIAQYLPRIPIAGRLVLEGPAPEQVQGSAAPDEDDDGIVVGIAGVVEGTCRPAGRVRFGARLVDAVSNGEFIQAGASVRVIQRQGNRVVVEKC